MPQRDFLHLTKWTEQKVTFFSLKSSYTQKNVKWHVSWSNSRKSESGSEVKQIHPIHCLKITEKVSFYDFTSEYILTEQKFIKMLKMANSAIFWKIEACGQIVLPDWWILEGLKLMENDKFRKMKWDIFGVFPTEVTSKYIGNIGKEKS